MARPERVRRRRTASNPPGIYEARSVDIRSFTAYKRRCLELVLDVYHGNAVDGVVLARVPMYFRVPARMGTLWPSSKLARLFQLLGPMPRSDKLPLNRLRHKLWRVEVGDNDEDGHQRRLHANQHYSVVRTVFERLA